jgi:hypothetical protein
MWTLKMEDIDYLKALVELMFGTLTTGGFIKDEYCS